jgi:Pentapeptide repeats (8 copies)
VAVRLDYEASCKRLHELGWPDSEPLRPSLSANPDTTMMRRSASVSFARAWRAICPALRFREPFSDAPKSREPLFAARICANRDFAGTILLIVDFSETILSDADLRASLFERVSFAGTDLRSADLRRSTFTNCVFDRASMKGTILTRRLGKTLSLSGSQLSEINWTDDDGEEPVGG